MRRFIASAVCFILVGPVLAMAGPPTDNPVATYYPGPEGYPAWTDGVHWANVIDMSQYGRGATDFEKFENARDELAAKGGGVLYYPAGTYDFSKGPFDGPDGRGLMIKSGVVIRGQAPSADADARSGKLTLGTKFVFGFQKKGVDEARRYGGDVPRDWNLVGLALRDGEQLGDVRDVGICWVHLAGATVFFGPQLKWGPTWGTAGGWKSKYVKKVWKDRVPDGTSPFDPLLGAPLGEGNFIGVGRGRLVFGCVLEDAAVLNDCFEEGNGPSSFYAYKFGPRIGVCGSRVLVANNLLPISTRNFKYAQTTRLTYAGKGNAMRLGDFVPDTEILFDYGKTGGIEVNKQSGAFGGGLDAEGVVVRDNWVFNHGHRGFHVAGNWVTIAGNRNERLFLKGGADVYGLGPGWTLTLDGNLRSSPGGNGAISDNLSRAFDLAGRQLWIDHNTFNNTGSDPGNDGEGILCQLHGGTHLTGWAITHNRHERGKGAAGYLGAWDVDIRGCLIAWNETAGWVGFVNVSKHDVVDCAVVANKGKLNATGENVITECPKVAPAAPKDVTASLYDKDAVRVAWADASDGEVGFRVDRSLDGGKTWTAIAYRPLHQKRTDPDALAWVDFTAPPGKALRYRVAAIDCKDNDAGARPATEALTIPVPGK